MSTKREQLEELDSDLLFADGFDEAIVGIVENMDKGPLVCYSIPKCLDVLIHRDGMSEEEAFDYFNFNVLSAYVGPKTPMWLSPVYDLPSSLEEKDTDPDTLPSSVITDD